DLEPYELGREFGETLAASFAPPILDRDRATIDPTEFAQPLHKSGNPLARGRRRARTQESNNRHLPRLLRARRERPRGRGAEQRDELAALHSITSSARASSVGGTSRPSALAVLRLSTSWNLTGAWTGSSLGFSPLRMRSA